MHKLKTTLICSTRTMGAFQLSTRPQSTFACVSSRSMSSIVASMTTRRPSRRTGCTWPNASIATMSTCGRPPMRSLSALLPAWVACSCSKSSSGGHSLLSPWQHTCTDRDSSLSSTTRSSSICAMWASSMRSASHV